MFVHRQNILSVGWRVEQDGLLTSGDLRVRLNRRIGKFPNLEYNICESSNYGVWPFPLSL